MLPKLVLKKLPKIKLKQLSSSASAPIILLQKHETVYYHHESSKLTKVAAFDFDDTIFKQYTTEYINPEIPSILRKVAENWQIVIFSNQKGISTGKTTIEDLTERVRSLRTVVPFSFYCSTEDDIYRKPHTGLYRLFRTHLNSAAVGLVPVSRI